MKFKKVSEPSEVPTYAVIVGGEVIGMVRKYEYVLFGDCLYWRYPGSSYRYDTRKEAAEALLKKTRKEAAEALLKNKEGEGVTA